MLTVLMATRNRARILPGVLNAFSCLRTPSSGWKLVVINNGSVDRTCDIVTAFKTSLPLTYTCEEKVGKNFALNTGLTYVEGDLAVLTDDDVFPHPDWLIRLRSAADAHAGYSLFGGVILPRWEMTPPQWLAWVPAGPGFTLTDPRLKEGPVDPGTLFGPNMAVRTDVFKDGTRFDPSIGPCGTNYAMGSETELVLRLGRQGHKAWHVQDAVVEHFIQTSQMNKSWVLERATRHGRGEFRLSKLETPEATSQWPGVAFAIYPRMLRRLMRMTKAWITSNEQDLFTARWDFNYNRGFIFEARRMRRQRLGLLQPS